MRFICTQSCHDSTPRSVDPRESKFRKGFRAGDTDKRGEEGYLLADADVKRLARVGLFPEYFDIGDEASARYIEEHREELIDIVENRELPFRELRPGEEPMPKGPVGDDNFGLPSGDMLGLKARERLKNKAREKSGTADRAAAAAGGDK